MFTFIKILIKAAYVILALLILIRTFLKANGISTLNFEHRGLLKILYEFTDQLIAPINFIFQKIAIILPSWAHKFFPNFAVEMTGGQLEWSGLITIACCLILGVAIERSISNFAQQAQSIFIKRKEAKPATKDNNRSLQRLREDKKESQKTDHKSEALKSAYNLIIKRLDREKTELLNKNITLEKELITDPLTGLKNRKYMEERLRYEFKHCKLRKNTLSIIMIDIDHFKKINDTYGHQEGDNVLREVSRIIINSCHGSIVAARYGGEEILIIGPKVEQTEARVLAESIRQTIEATIKCGEEEERVTISAGVATYQGKRAVESIEKLIEEADNALYQAKNEGRNRVKACSI